MNTKFWGFVLLSTFGIVSAATSFAGQLQDEVYQELNSPRSMSTEALCAVQDTQFLMVDGIFGDYFRANFTPAEEVLNKQWNGEGGIILPPTTVTIPDNAETLPAKLRALRATSHKPRAVLIAHSKGGAESLLMLLHHPEIVRELNIVSVGLVSGVIGGTPLMQVLDSVCGKNPNNIFCFYMFQMFPSLHTFTPSVIQPIFTDALQKMNQQDRAMLEPMIHYVRTQMPASDIKSPLYAVNLWMRMYAPAAGPNDGAIPTANQLIYENGFGPNSGPVFGTDLGIMMGDHNSLLNKATKEDRNQYREAFFRVFARKLLGI